MTKKSKELEELKKALNNKKFKRNIRLDKEKQKKVVIQKFGK